MNAICLTCKRPFETIEVKVMHFTFPGSRYCDVCRHAEEIEQAESHASARFVRTGVPLAYRDCSFAITLTEPGQAPRTFRRGVRLTAAQATPSPQPQTFKVYLNAEAIAARDAGTTPRR